jgi:hypothetical protein
LHNIVHHHQPSQSIQCTGNVVMVNDTRDQYRHIPSQSNCKHVGHYPIKNHNHISSSNWYQRLISMEQIQLLMIVGPSITSDSRKYQIQMIQYILLLYQQLLDDIILLLPDTNTNENNKQQQQKFMIQNLIRIRIVPPKELKLMESSRIVIEGYLHDNKYKNNISLQAEKQQQQSNNVHPICLAYISNLQDFGTRNVYRFGSSKSCVTSETYSRNGLHILHGTICNTAQTMTWIAQYGKRNYQSDTFWLQLPSCLLSYCSGTFGQHQSIDKLEENNDIDNKYNQLVAHNKKLYKLSYLREIVGIGKNGRRITKDITYNDSIMINSTNHTPKDDIAAIDNSNQRNQKQILPEQQRSKDRIRGEELCSPFHSFLPFYNNS